MGHPVIDNCTGFAFEPAFLTDEELRPLFVPIVKATFSFDDNNRLVLSRRQPSVDLAGASNGPEEPSSWRYEPEAVPPKIDTDCVLIGHAHAHGARQVDVGFRIGPVQKVVRVFGPRRWYRALASIAMTAPEPFDRMPLVYELAFGGHDRLHDGPESQAFEYRNPVGSGYRTRWRADEPSVHLPNLEDPDHLIRGFQDRPPPAAFGFVSANWRPRALLAGTYDKAWSEGRAPRLPLDFDRRFFNAASPGLQSPGRLAGNEPVTVIGATPAGRLDFCLPGVPAPVIDVELRAQRRQTMPTALDTVIVDLDAMRVTLLWRASLPVRDVPHDLKAIVVGHGDRPRAAATANSVL